MIEIELLDKIANSQFAYLIMFMGLLGFVIKTSYEREQKMNEQLDKTIPILNQILMRLDLIEEKMEK